MLDDIDALFALYAKPHMTDYIEPLYDREAEIAYRRDYIENVYEVFGYGMWGIFYKENGELIGVAGMEFRGGYSFDTADIGYVFAPEYRGSGLCEEVMYAIIDYARINTGLARLRACVRDDNVISRHIVAKLGFYPTGDWVEDERVWFLDL